MAEKREVPANELLPINNRVKLLAVIKTEVNRNDKLLVDNIIINNDQDCQNAFDFGNEIKTEEKRLDDLVNRYIKPLKAVVGLIKTATGLKAYQDDLNKSITVVKLAIEDYKRKKRLEREKAEAIARELAKKEAEKLEKRAEKAKKPETKERLLNEAELTRTAPIMSPVNNVGSSMKRWTYKIINFSELDDKFKIEDSKKLNQHANKYKDTSPVKGVVFYEKESARFISGGNNGN